MINNKIRLIKNCNKEAGKLSYKEFLVNKDLDLSNEDIALNISIYNTEIKNNYTCKIPLHIWKVELNNDKEVELYKGQQIKDKQRLYCIGTSLNVFAVEGEDVYMRDISFDYINIGKGFIEYNKKRDCAILTITL